MVMWKLSALISDKKSNESINFIGSILFRLI